MVFKMVCVLVPRLKASALGVKETRMKMVLVILAACWSWSVANAQSSAQIASQSAAPLTTVASLDVPRYMGTWYEIAHYPNWFQKKCVADTRAEYRLQADATVQVINRCRQADGSIAEAVGQARQIGAANSPRLQVRFAPAWLSWLPFVWGNYWVIDLDDRYQLVAVSEPTREYLWVLARTPEVGSDAYAALLSRLEARGFDLARLQRTQQTP